MTNSSIKKTLLIWSVVLVVILASYLVRERFVAEKNLNYVRSLPPVVVILSEDGFSPQEITIEKGQTVEFKTTKGKPFWPASDLHPSHLIYPEFDPLEPVSSDKVWSFQFDKVGQWHYHDHLFPYYRGVVNVILAKNITKVSDCDETLSSAVEGDKFRCGDELITYKLKKEGLASAMTTLSELYNRDPFWRENCHELTHLLGQQAYLEFSKKGSIPIGPETAYCGYGFFHGFMEGLFASGGNVDEGRKLCAYMENQVIDKMKFVGTACYHGIGHGLVDGSDKKSWGNALKLLRPGLDMCDKVAETSGDHSRCYSGAFNSIWIAIGSSQWGLQVDKVNPYGLCEQLQVKYRSACYADAMIAVMKVTDRNFSAGLGLVEKIKEDLYARSAVSMLSGLTSRDYVGKNDWADIILACHNSQKRLVNDCLTSFAAGLVEFGEPNKEYEKAIIFCNSPDLIGEEKKLCFQRIISYFNVIYSPEKIKSLEGMLK
ncbi:hypothetical protein H0W91_03695 [Patescibacteria group bacterium]|nr:hypothetical protein [Patescibacteria group bacterium]